MGKFKSVFKAIGFGGSTPKIPVPPPPEAPAPVAAPATAANAQLAKAGRDSRQRAAAARAGSTVGEAGAGGLTKPPKTANVTLLGE